MNASDWQAVILTLKLACGSTFILLMIGPPVAWWLAGKRHPIKTAIEAMVALPLVLPPTVLGFYLLIAFSPTHFIGRMSSHITGAPLAFHFSGLLIASVLYSFPFVVQPLQATFKSLDRRYIEQGKLMRLSVLARFYYIILPMTLPSFVSATLLAFAHTIGEFGVVLLIGGNIPGETRVLSIALFDHVEAMDYSAAHRLAIALLAFSMTVLVLVYGVLGRRTEAAQCN